MIRLTRRQAEVYGMPTDHPKKRKKAKGPDPLYTGDKEARSFDALCVAAGLPVPIHEYAFCDSRKWRADYCWPEFDLLVEVEGGAWIAGRHTRGKGFVADCEKYAEACVLGWRLLRVTPQMVSDGRLFRWLKRIQRA